MSANGAGQWGVGPTKEPSHIKLLGLIEVSMVSHDSPLSVNVVHENGSLLLVLAGELDIATRPRLRKAVGELLGPHLRAVTLDLSALDFVDVAGLRALLDVKEMAAGVEAEFRLRSVSARTHQVIRLVDFDELEAAIGGDPAPSGV
jgi:anti-anti-sigma factor